jgi:hypothetical protein
VCSCTCVFQANSRLKQIEKEYTQKLAKSSQVSIGKRNKVKPKQKGEMQPTYQTSKPLYFTVKFNSQFFMD